MSSSDENTSQTFVSESDEQYVKLTHREHVLARPDSYIGSTELREEKMWVCERDGQFVHKNINWAPGLYKIFDEILVNAADNKQREPKLQTIKVEIKPEENKISVWNDGRGISISKQFDPSDGKEYWKPEFIFGQLLTSSNYDDTKEKTTGGRNGYGAKLANIYSTKFILDLYNTVEGLSYHQEFSDNMGVIGEAIVDKPKKALKSSYTCVTFYPDLKRFNLEKIGSDMLALMTRRVYDMAGILDGVKVYLNDELIEIKNWDAYCKKYLDGSDSNLITTIVNDNWKIALAPAKGEFRQISFVNAVNTPKGGNHVNLVTKHIVSFMTDYLETRKGKSKARVKPRQVKAFLFVFVNALIPNPTFDSQTKDTLTLPTSKFSEKFEIPKLFFEKIKKTPIPDLVLELAHFKDKSLVNKMKGTKKKKLFIEKLEDANEAGKKESSQCTLILTEGDSAKSMAVTGLSVVGRDYFGVFPLRGKLLNTRDASPTVLANNEEIQHIMQIMALDPQMKYEDGIDSLRYGHIMIMADQDVDGSHIKGLIINFIHSMWPSLIKIPGFLCEFVTPIVKVSRLSKVISFFTIPEFVNWKRDNNGGKGWKIKYYKGLATSTPEETKGYFSNFSRHKIDFVYGEENDEERINLAFSKKRADDRKIWLSNLDPETTYLGQDTDTISYSDFVDRELILFSNYANIRSIPSIIDGWKPGQRKILWVCLKNNIVKEVKVSQLAGKVSLLSAYHHGEDSLCQTIIGMAQDFVGSNNINVLKPIGMLGTRLMGGQDSGMPRYVYTELSPITRRIFHKEDDALLKYQADEGLPIEPVFYVPIIPMVLVNGSRGIGFGWSTDVPQFNPLDIIDNLRRKMRDEPIVPMDPWYSGFRGTITRLENGKWEVTGIVKKVNSTTIDITELPLFTWTYDYKRFLESLMTGEDKTKKTRKTKEATEEVKKFDPLISDFREYHSNVSVYFKVLVTPEQMAHIEEIGMNKFFKLTQVINSSNMTLFSSTGGIKQYKTAEEILEEFYPVRMQYYHERKLNMIRDKEGKLMKLTNQARFIKEFIDEIIELRNIPKKKILQILIDRHYDMIDPDEKKKSMKISEEAVIEEAKETTEEEEKEESDDDGAKSDDPVERGYDYLLSMKIWSMTKERYEKLLEQKEQAAADLLKIQETDEKTFWTTDLDSIQDFWKEFESARELLRKENRADANLSMTNSKPLSAKRKVTKKSKSDVSEDTMNEKQDSDSDAYAPPARKPRAPRKTKKSESEEQMTEEGEEKKPKTTKPKKIKEEDDEEEKKPKTTKPKKIKEEDEEEKKPKTTKPKKIKEENDDEEKKPKTTKPKKIKEEDEEEKKPKTTKPKKIKEEEDEEKKPKTTKPKKIKEEDEEEKKPKTTKPKKIKEEDDQVKTPKPTAKTATDIKKEQSPKKDTKKSAFEEESSDTPTDSIALRLKEKRLTGAKKSTSLLQYFAKESDEDSSSYSSDDTESYSY